MINTRPWPRCNLIEEKGGTDPYCPSERAVTSNDAPFVIESDDELPAEMGKPVGMRLRDSLDEGD